MSSPLLVLGAGQRCGSTLMQRLVSSHPDAFIWGECEGHLARMLEAAEYLVYHSAARGNGARREFAALGHQGFIANLMPEPMAVARAFGDFCAQLFATPGARVWGFKEVRYDLHLATRLHRFLPGLRVIFIVRDPRDVLCSLDAWEGLGWWSRAQTREAIENWQRIAASFQETTQVPVLALRYEDYTADPAGTARRIGEFTGLDPVGLDLSVFDRKVHNLAEADKRVLRRWDELPIDLRELLSGEAIQSTAKAYEYRLG